MADFEEKYKAWLTAVSQEFIDAGDLTMKQNLLIESLSSLRSVYPESRLYDCNNENQDSVLLLNYSVLGSTNEDENDNV